MTSTLTNPTALSTAAASVAISDRAVARAVDLAVVGAPAVGLVALFGPVGVLLGLALMYVYESLAVAITGTTLGKRLKSLRVVDVDTGDKPMPAKAGSRVLVVVALAAVAQIVAGIGPMVAVFVWGSAAATMDRRGLADRMARTAVVPAAP
ncbi:MAG: RDD family protein [Acidimicrobiales bacterium]|nr:RDD family protein [Acidimicrobiales bacterium]